MAAMTRGPLPPSVYWRRRLVLLTVALVVIWGLVHLLGGGSDNTPTAASVAAITSTTPQPTPSGTPTGDPTLAPLAGTTSPSSSIATVPSTSPSPSVLPSPTGACPASDVSVTPSVGTATAGSDVTVVLNLQTFSTPACTWRVGHKTMQVKITTARGEDVWSTVQCKSALPDSTVTLYQDQPTPVTLTWSSKKADEACDGHTDWAAPGAYQVTGVALGGEPDEAPFTLSTYVAPPKPTPSSTPSTSASATATPKSTTSTPATKVKKKHVVAD